MSGPAFRELIRRIYRLLRGPAVQPALGRERSFFAGNDVLAIAMVSHGLDKPGAQAVWQPFLDWIAASPQDYRLTGKPVIASMPARNWWDAEFRKKHIAGRDHQRPAAGREPPRFLVDRRPRPDRRVLARLRVPVAAGSRCSRRPAEPHRRRAVRREPALEARDTIQQRIRRRSGRRDRRVARHRDQSGRARPPLAWRSSAAWAARLSRHPRLRARPRRGARRGGDDRQRHGRVAQGRAGASVLCFYVSESNFFEKDWQRSYWGENYRAAACRQAPIRPGRPILCPSRRR